MKMPNIMLKAVSIFLLGKVRIFESPLNHSVRTKLGQDLNENFRIVISMLLKMKR